jgi:membrane fusion protein (multidrug efflux system)
MKFDPRIPAMDGGTKYEPVLERSDRVQTPATPVHSAVAMRVARRRRRRWRLVLGVAAGVALLAGALGYGHYYLTTGRYLESTDDAYLQADNTPVSPKIAGYVATVAVDDNQSVKAGDLLVRIDDRDYKAALDQAAADVAGAEADLKNLDAQIALQQSMIDQAAADVQVAGAALQFAGQDAGRYRALVKDGYGTVQRSQQADSDLRQKTATVERQRAALAATKQQIAVLQTARLKDQANLARAQAALEQAKLNLSYTELRAPIDGAIGDRTVRLGQYVQPGTQLLTVVPMRQGIYAVANFKETQLAHMVRGEQVTLAVDSFPGATVTGRVDSLAPGTGSQFALLPPENATGNFTKIVQRVPVKILIDPSSPLIDRLRPGLSVIATVDTRSARATGTRLAAGDARTAGAVAR